MSRFYCIVSTDEYDTIIVAAYGFRRGGLAECIDELLRPGSFGYGVVQGSIGIECCEEDPDVSTSLAQ